MIGRLASLFPSWAAPTAVLAAPPAGLARRPAPWAARGAALSAADGSGDAPVAAAIMIVGDEILAGSIADTNTPWLAKMLHARGVDVIRAVYVPDDPDDIAATCLGLRERVGPSGFVFSSGGIGPTHDDKTYGAIASALGLRLQLHPPTVEKMREHYSARGLELNEARLRMATLPTPSEVLFTPGLWVPLVAAAGNVYILPGVPRLFQAMVQAHVDRFRGPAFHSRMLLTDEGEGDLAAPLAAVAAAHPAVRVGSYPNVEWDQQRPGAEVAYRVKLVVEGRDERAVEAAAAAVQEAVQTQCGPGA